VSVSAPHSTQRSMVGRLTPGSGTSNRSLRCERDFSSPREATDGSRATLTAMTVWDEIDDGVLRWVFALPPSFDTHEILDFPINEPIPFGPIPELDTGAVTKSLERLRGHGLIAGECSRWFGGDGWHDLRVTARGLMYLGEWPDLDLVATAASMNQLLRLAAAEAPETDRPVLLRAAGVVGRTVDGVVRGTLAEVAHAGGEEIAE
jgi:hypothetical protein